LWAGVKAIRHPIAHARAYITKVFPDETRAVSGSHAILHHEEENFDPLTMTEVTFVLTQVSSLASFFS
jgi:hypothetical protein